MGKKSHLHLSYKKYDVTIRIGSAMMADVHLHAARLYSGLEVEILAFELSEARGGTGVEVAGGTGLLAGDATVFGDLGTWLFWDGT